jgi:type I restriction enzyme, S subunit
VSKGWRRSTWGDEISLEYGKAIRGYQDAVAPFRVFGSNGPIGWHENALAKGPGVILGRKGAYRGVHFSPDPFFVIDTAYYVKPKSDLDMRWLYYAIIHHKLGEIDDGSPIPSTTRAAVYVRDIDVPPLLEQRAIAATLGALDEKIELNRKMNATLEAMARALFRDWFVDFGPTRAKMAGREPYLAPDLWALFPDGLDDEGKPEGWEEKPLDEVAHFLNGLALQKFPGESEPDSLPVIKIAELRNGITEKSNRASRKVPAQYVIRDGDFLFSWSGSLLAKFWIGGEGALNQHLFKVTSDRYPAWFYSEWVQHHLEEFQIIAASKATTMGHIQRGHLKAAMTICPPDHVIEKMGLIIAPMFDQIIHNNLESRTLAQTRDLLLPRLMSGELRVADLATTEGEAAA